MTGSRKSRERKNGGKRVSAVDGRRKVLETEPTAQSHRPVLWDRLDQEKEGVVMLDGLRIVFLPASTLVDIQAAGEKILGRGLGAILYEAGVRTGREIALFALRTAGSASPGAILRFMESGHAERGYGQVSFVTTDLDHGGLTARVHDSPYVETREPHRGTACYFPLGFWVGFVESISGTSVTGAETQCRSKGAKFCEFSVRPSHQLELGSKGPSKP